MFSFHCLLIGFVLSVYIHNAKGYENNEKVILYVNKVGPYFNPHETYHYYQLPVCRPQKIEHKSLTLGEVLEGDRMAYSMYNISFRVPMKNEKLCTLSLNEKEISQLKEAVEDLYYFEFILDDLPLHGFIGHLEEGGFLPHSHKIFLWTQYIFNIMYNNDKIISANVSTAGVIPVNLNEAVAPFHVTHTYSVNWIETKETYEDRLKKLSSTSFFPKTLEIHWLSVINSAVLVMLLIGFVIVILTRILRNDFARYNGDVDDIENLECDEYGWKIIRGDIFRFPQQKSLFCAILGVGCQFLSIIFGIVIMSLMDLFNVHKHGAMNSIAFLLYAFTSGIAGYVSASMYKQMGGKLWVWNINLTSFLFSGPFFIIWSIQNTIAWAYASTQALPASTIVLLLAVWLCVGYPLCITGGVLGKNWSGNFDAPCRTKHIPREIPPVNWYHSSVAHCIIGGFLPFSAISVELYYIFATVWGREQYTLYGVLFIVFFILLNVTACISVALTYFQLSSEDYKWWWRSIFNAGSTGMFVFIYATFYYLQRSNMEGLLQAVEFFGYTLLTCYVFFLTLGTVSFYASYRFVKYIYQNVKAD
ncbi:transmembrane 9 superfamily member 1 [Trichonephila inaurata madagascariensis]|uniref:Transmembrane 9 superfamily member n=1 Tax=Trichonephila inaurata madagascariensis TaxID=2747483 RepID=A0A8X7CFM3_9ARAC|nr:transmembrane 9 superfamily member 1 [Trichonephila inaurata madagascariensis]